MPRPQVPVNDTIPTKRGRGRPPAPVVDYPPSLWSDWADPETFAEALDLHMRRHGDTTWSLFRAVRQAGGVTDRTTLGAWRRGVKSPGTPESLRVLEILETRYRLPAGYFRKKQPQGRALLGHQVANTGNAERRRLAWHLPDDFNRRSLVEQTKILDWVRSNILSGGTDYHRYQSEMSRHRFAIRFDGAKRARSLKLNGQPRAASVLAAPPPRLAEEMRALLRFKTAILTEVGFQRSGVWGSETAAQKVEHLGLMFGAMAAAADGEVKGLGVPSTDLSMALLVCPAIWDWYVQWREARRGFYTGWEAEMLLFGAALTRQGTGWLRQSPDLALRLASVPDLVSAEDIERIRTDWGAACDDLHRHVLARAKEVQRVARVHRDPFEPLLPVLEAASPVGEYRKIADEVLRRLPDERRSPRAFAEAVRSFLMIRLGLHLGLRQKNMRELLFRVRGEPITPERELERLKRGELRWSERDAGWEVFIPCAAFKNAHSVYFSKRPFRLVLPDLGDLYRWIESYIDRQRPLLLAEARDPGTFFVKTVKRSSSDAAYGQNTFYEAWRITIQRYGIYNPFTERGAIKGLLPHGPHSVRDVLATHVLKQSGSYEQASYAIQDTPATVADHYGRFLPQDKAALAAQVLNRVWQDP